MSTMSPGVELAIVLAGGCVTTFLAVATLEMIREGRARRAEGRLETTDDAQRLEAGAPPPTRQQVPEAMPIDRPAQARRTEHE
jgi:hypothetical protein